MDNINNESVYKSLETTSNVEHNDLTTSALKEWSAPSVVELVNAKTNSGGLGGVENNPLPSSSAS
ncbi:hypothetical protein [Marinomonas mediterranea]|uniref:hypothetical protein n=1 Tax=Marinomonas mediterranea TaxID=119864 RepID=UPI00234B72DC|nr:hypothetical protein [Marinomonas mediterranea]WCN08581.1 hypothetical protein GV055_06380 [Marinomonas mediterranea]WCN12635.1 hypothetical protein GV054_06220 [Marinomonas mediterranea]